MYSHLTQFIFGLCVGIVALTARAENEAIPEELAARARNFAFQFDEGWELTGVYSQGNAIPTIAGSLRITAIQISKSELRLLASRSSLKSLSLSYSNVADEDLSELRSLPKLEFLGLAWTGVTDNTFKTIATFRTLKKLDLRMTKVSSEAIARFEKETNVIVLSGPTSEAYAARIIRDERRCVAMKLAQIKTDEKTSGLYFLGSEIDDAAIAGLSVGRQIERLSFRETGVSAARLKKLFECAPQLEAIFLADLTIDRELAATLSNLKNVRYLDIRGCRIDDDSVAALGRNRSLRYLKLPAKTVSDADLKALTEITSLVELDVSAAEVSDAGIASFANHRTLTRIIAYHTDVTYEGAAALERRLIGGQVLARPPSQLEK